MTETVVSQRLSQFADEGETCAAEDPAEAAEVAGLRYVSDMSPGIRRRRRGKHFSYLAPDGKLIQNATELERIKALKIPPAWKDVWICPSKQGHLQATGRDSKGRKQYRYHDRWREVRDATKYEHLILFGESLPTLRRRVDEELETSGLPSTRVLATIIRLLDLTLIRIGNEEYVQSNNSYGLTTLRNRHATIKGDSIRLHFRGKHGKEHTIDVQDRELARIVKRCRDLPGQELFHYLDDEGNVHAVDSSEVNEYLRALTGQPFTAKDFRTWGGSVLAMHTLRELGNYSSETEAKKHVTQAIKTAAEHLGNTPAICRKCYVHPGLLNAYLDGSLLAYLREHPRRVQRGAPWELHPDEAIFLDFLHTLPANSP